MSTIIASLAFFRGDGATRRSIVRRKKKNLAWKKRACRDRHPRANAIGPRRGFARFLGVFFFPGLATTTFAIQLSFFSPGFSRKDRCAGRIGAPGAPPSHTAVRARTRVPVRVERPRARTRARRAEPWRRRRRSRASSRLPPRFGAQHYARSRDILRCSSGREHSARGAGP